MTIDLSEEMEDFGGQFYVYRYLQGRLHQLDATVDLDAQTLSFQTKNLGRFVITDKAIADGTLVDESFAGTQQAPSENTNQNNQISQSGSHSDGQNGSYSENQDYQAGGVDKTNPDTGAEDHLALAAAAAAVIAKKREEQNAQIKRREQMLMDYPGLIMKFTLLVQAGLTARKAFQKIALDYGKREDGKKREAYEEIRVACYEMDSGISEAEAYRRFGERCGQVKYKTLSTLLIQNLQKGSRYLADLLEKESVEAWEERKRKARVLGDTAATKLLLPMVLMLLVVMAVIMLPACLSFYGG